MFFRRDWSIVIVLDVSSVFEGQERRTRVTRAGTMLEQFFNVLGSIFAVTHSSVEPPPGPC